MFINFCFSIYNKNKDCLPFYFSKEELEYINTEDHKHAQHWIEENLKHL